MANVTRDQIAKVVDNDPEMIRELEQLFANSLTIRTVTGSGKITDEDEFIPADATDGMIELELPSATDRVGKQFAIKKVDETANPVRIMTNGTELIDKKVTYFDLDHEDEAIEVISDGSGWFLK